MELAIAAGSERAGARPPQPTPAEPDFERRVRFFAKDTEQYHFCLGGPGLAREDERRFALRVLEGVLGGTSSSRLFQEVRERRGLAYSVFCFSSLYAHTGEVGLYVGTRPENLTEAVETIATELERFVEDPASAEELDRSRENLKGRMVLSLESTGARMSRLGISVLNGLPILSVDEVIERIDAVDVAALGELAGELFVPNRSVGRLRRPRGGGVPRGAHAAGGSRGMIRVAVAGAAGRMGETVCAAVEGAEDMELVGRVDPLLGTTLEDVLTGSPPARGRRGFHPARHRAGQCAELRARRCARRDRHDRL